jgi:hypothetical protein
MKSVTHSFGSKPVENETIHLNANGIKAIVNVMTGIEHNIWVFYCPSLNVSGYGNTKEEAHESFDHNIEVFLKDMFVLNLYQRIKYIKSLGWKQDKIFNKQYSKAYIDKDGQLNNLEVPELVSVEAEV